jgi:hypothetical protein
VFKSGISTHGLAALTPQMIEQIWELYLLITRDVAIPNNIYALIDFFIEMLPQIPTPTKPTKPVLSMTSCAVSMQGQTYTRCRHGKTPRK